MPRYHSACINYESRPPTAPSRIKSERYPYAYISLTSEINIQKFKKFYKNKGAKDQRSPAPDPKGQSATTCEHQRRAQTRATCGRSRTDSAHDCQQGSRDRSRPNG